ncbi:AmmeMemoRadiSam system protein B [Candidatus Omnitrophota bacterium]
MEREAVVAGQFYPSNNAQLLKQIESFIDTPVQKQAVKGLVMPHAGYVYSGKVAAETISSADLEHKRIFVIIGPNHRGQGKRFSIMKEGTWKMPSGDVRIDTELAKKILDSSQYLEEDSLAHSGEHSIEVQLPLIQYFKKDFAIVPIIVYPAALEIYKEIAAAIALSIKESHKEKEVVIIASSDMTHYESQVAAEKKDNLALEALLSLDEEELFHRVKRFNISMCGYAPAVIMLNACKALGAKNARLIKYQTSGSVTGDFSSVVGYAGLLID